MSHARLSVVLLGIATGASALETPFDSRLVIDNTGDNPRTALVADVDGDGDNDVVTATLADNTFAWYENDGTVDPLTPPTFTKHVLTTNATGAREVWVADINNDGRLDILGAARADNSVLWYRNEGGVPATFTEFLIADDVLSSWSVYAADIDGDGDMDVTSAGRDDDLISWHENDGADPPTWTKHVIDTDARRAQKAFADDVDGDGDMDMLSASGAGDEIAWYENDGAPDPSFTKHSLTTSANNAKWVWTADLDRDGDVDILAAAETEATIEWFENDGAPDPSFTRRLIASVGGAKACVPYDFDHDGDLDVLSNGIGLDHISIHENLGGSPLAWTTHVVSTESDNPLTAFPGDLNGDGRADIVAASFEDDTIGWYPNVWIRPDPAFPEILAIDRYPVEHETLTYADVNRDGTGDFVLTAPSGEVQWMTVVAGGPPMTHDVATLTSPSDSAVADLDRDGDPDIAVTDLSGTLYVCASDGADPPVFTPTSAAAGLGALSGVATGDIDLDGDPDVVATSPAGQVYVLLNDGATPASFMVTTIDTTALGARDPEVYDINKDGAPDILVPAADLDRVILYQNNHDSPATFQRRVMPDNVPGPWDIEVIDLNNDGDDDLAVALLDGFSLHMMLSDGAHDVTLSGFGWSASNLVAIDTGNPDFNELEDVVGFSLTDDTVRYGLNYGGDNPFVVFTALPYPRPGTTDLAYEDFDHDGLPDIILLSSNDGNSTLSWYPNRGGQARVLPMSIANTEALIGRLEALFALRVTNLGNRYDESATLVGTRVSFEGPDGAPLTTPEAQALISRVLVYADTNMTSTFERLGDEIVFEQPLSALDPDGGFEIAIDHTANDFDLLNGNTRLYFVVVELTPGSAAATPNQFSAVSPEAIVGDVLQTPHEVPLRLALGSSAETPLITATVPAPGQVLFGDPWIRHTVDNTLHGAEGPRGADVNGDGHTDYAVAWEQSHYSRLYLHPGDAQLVRHPWPSVTVGHAANAETAVPFDLDGDGDFEVLSAISAGPRTIRAHFPPDDPADILDDTLWTTENFTQTPVDLWVNIEPADIDGENGTDLIIGSIGREGNFMAQIGWLRCPEDPADTTAWTYHQLIEVHWALGLTASDMDHDGDLDVVYSNRFGDSGQGDIARGVFWLENPGAGAPDLTDHWELHEIGSVGGEVGYLDLVTTAPDDLAMIAVPVRPRKTDIHTALDTTGLLWDSVRLPWPDDMGTTKAARFADIDLDGHLDLVLTAVEAREDEGLVGVAWLRNPGTPDGDWNAYDIAGLEGEKFDIVAIEDIDGDGDLDVLTSEEPDNDPLEFGLGFVWYENPAFQPTGDANRDRVTNAGDLATLLAEWGPATFLTASDFNYDGVVDATDLATLLASWDVQWGPGAGE